MMYNNYDESSVYQYDCGSRGYGCGCNSGETYPRPEIPCYRPCACHHGSSSCGCNSGSGCNQWNSGCNSGSSCGCNSSCNSSNCCNSGYQSSNCRRRCCLCDCFRNLFRC